MQIDSKFILNAIIEEFELSDLKDKLKEYGALDLNPLDDGDFSGYVEATELTREIILKAVSIAERVVAEAREIGKGKEKLEAVVDFLDAHIQLGFFLDKIIDLDGRVLKLTIPLLISTLNNWFGKNWLKHYPPQ